MVIIDHREMDEIRQCAGLDVSTLWLRYVTVGGGLHVGELQAYLEGHATITNQDYEMLAVVLNEALDDAGVEQAVPYADD